MLGIDLKDHLSALASKVRMKEDVIRIFASIKIHGFPLRHLHLLHNCLLQICISCLAPLPISFFQFHDLRNLYIGPALATKLFRKFDDFLLSSRFSS